jgi:hypothetical protein
MVAHPEVEVRILALTCTVAAAVRARCQRPRRYARPAGTGCGRLPAAVCAKYVPKFQAATLIPGGRGPTQRWASLCQPCHCYYSSRRPRMPTGATAARSVADECVTGAADAIWTAS